MSSIYPQRTSVDSLIRRSLFRRLSFRDHEFHHYALSHRMMICVYGRYLDLVRSWSKACDDDRPTAGVGPYPRSAINCDMEMPDTGRHIDCLRPEHRNDLQI